MLPSRRWITCGLFAVLFAAIAVAAAATGKPAVLVMAHGGSRQWNEAVLQAVAPLRGERRVEVAFGMADACSLREAIRKLESSGATEAAVVRVFVSGDSFLERTRQILGLEAGAPEPSETSCPARSEHGAHSMAWFHVASTLHFAISEQGLAEAPEMGPILADRARGLSAKPANEDVLILAHGPGDDAQNLRWIETIGERADAIRAALPFHQVAVATLREDWPEKRQVAEAEIRAAIARSTAEGRTTIVIPFRVEGFGPYAAVLDGLTYASDGRGLLPHPNVSAWIERQVQELSVALASVPAAAEPLAVSTARQP